jgi:hypothetical protein
MDKIEYHEVIKFFVKVGLTPKEIHSSLMPKEIHSKFIKVYGRLFSFIFNN